MPEPEYFVLLQVSIPDFLAEFDREDFLLHLTQEEEMFDCHQMKVVVVEGRYSSQVVEVVYNHLVVMEEVQVFRLVLTLLVVAEVLDVEKVLILMVGVVVVLLLLILEVEVQQLFVVVEEVAVLLSCCPYVEVGEELHLCVVGVVEERLRDLEDLHGLGEREVADVGFLDLFSLHQFLPASQ